MQFNELEILTVLQIVLMLIIFISIDMKLDKLEKTMSKKEEEDDDEIHGD